MAGPPDVAPPSGLKLWFAGARPRTLPAAIVPVLVGTACAAGFVNTGANLPSLDGPTATKGIVIWKMVAAMIVALAIQVGTNYANDYSDGIKGTDNETRVGPLRLVGSGLATPSSVKKAAFLSFGVAAVAGLALAAAVGWWLILVGLVSFAAGWFYTGGPRPYGYAGLGEVFVFVFFGIVATVGSAYVQMLHFTWLAFVSSIAVGCLATALLVINNLRDIPTDTVSGKRTLAVKLGDQRTRVLYVVLMALPYVCLPFIAGASSRIWAVVAFLAIIPAQVPVLKVLQGAKGPALIPVLGATGRVQLIFGVLLTIGLFVSAPTLT